MNFVINGINNINEFNDDYIFDTIDVFKCVDVNVCNNVNIKTNSINLDIEILSVDIFLENKTIKKIKSNINYIYIINFMYYIKIKIYKNKNVEEIEIRDLWSKSIIFKDINDSYLDIYPISFHIENIDNKLGIALNIIIVDKSKAINFENRNLENSIADKNIVKKNYSYIDINVEFT